MTLDAPGPRMAVLTGRPRMARAWSSNCSPNRRMFAKSRIEFPLFFEVCRASISIESNSCESARAHRAAAPHKAQRGRGRARGRGRECGAAEFRAGDPQTGGTRIQRPWKGWGGVRRCQGVLGRAGLSPTTNTDEGIEASASMTQPRSDCLREARCNRAGSCLQRARRVRGVG